MSPCQIETFYNYHWNIYFSKSICFLEFKHDLKCWKRTKSEDVNTENTKYVHCYFNNNILQQNIGQIKIKLLATTCYYWMLCCFKNNFHVVIFLKVCSIMFRCSYYFRCLMYKTKSIFCLEYKRKPTWKIW